MSRELKITEALLKRMQILFRGDKLNASECKDALCQEMLKEGILVCVKNGRGMVCYAPEAKALQEFLASKNDAFRNLETSAFKDAGEIHRADLARTTGNSKIQKVRSCKGFLVNSYDSIDTILNGKHFVVNPPDGIFVFISDFENFVLPKNVVVVGIENMENFRFVAHQKMIFEKLRSELQKDAAHLEDVKLLFVSRYPQTGDLVKWLKNIPNVYIHFGDLDLAGIHIFLTEFYANLGNRANFLIPHDAELRISHGSTKRYDDQAARFESMIVTDPRVQPLVNLIKKYHKGYDQEGYIETSPSNFLRFENILANK